MLINTEETPNPNAVKFLPGMEVNSGQPIFFENPEEASKHNILASGLFSIEGVDSVFFGADFITVTKAEKYDWEVVKPEILMLVMDHVLAGLPFIDEKLTSSEPGTTPEHSEAKNETEKEIIEIIETRVRPSVAMDGGDIVFEKFEDGIVYLRLKGACSGCPSSTITLKNGIESMLQHYVPEVQSVEAIEG